MRGSSLDKDEARKVASKLIHDYVQSRTPSVLVVKELEDLRLVLNELHRGVLETDIPPFFLGPGYLFSPEDLFNQVEKGSQDIVLHYGTRIEEFQIILDPSPPPSIRCSVVFRINRPSFSN